jgi:hypothetical protein
LTRAGKWTEAAAALRELAHYGPNAGAYVYNGDFDHRPGIQPFDWKMGQSVGFMPSIGEAPERAGKALRVEYDGFSSPSPIQQVLLLNEGRYRLSVDVYEETNSGEDRLSWILACPGFAQPLARLSIKSPARHVWRQEAAEVMVPHSCPSQLLQLIADPGDRHTSIVPWYDNLRIVRR